MTQRIAIALVTLLLLLGAMWLAAIAIVACDIMAEAFAMQHLELPEIEIQKSYAHWGPLDCGGKWTCDDDGLCCIYCTNLDTGEPVLRCHDLTPAASEKISEWYQRMRWKRPE